MMGIESCKAAPRESFYGEVSLMMMKQQGLLICQVLFHTCVVEIAYFLENSLPNSLSTGWSTVNKVDHHLYKGFQENSP
jgi:hypothetical protein